MPSGLNATELTTLVWPAKATLLSSLRSQTSTRWSPPHEANDLPSGLNATQLTADVWPASVRSSA